MSSSGSVHGAVVLLLGPHLGAISGVSAHLKAMLRSRLGEDFVLDHFPVGSEGRNEGRAGRAVRLLTSAIALAAQIRKRRPVLVHVNTSLNVGAFWRDLLFVLVSRVLRVPVVFQVHGGKLPQAFFGRSPALQWLLRRMLMLPEAIVVLAEQELRAYRTFLPNRLVVLIANAVDSLAFASARTRRYGAAGPLRLVYLGRLAREKGLYELLQAQALALASEVDAHLTVIGAGPDEAALRETVQRLQIGGAVHFAGAAFGRAKADLLGSTDVFVLPSYAEGLPCALLEAMAAGNAVIATKVGAIPDIVVPALHGILLPPRNVPAITSAIGAMAADRAAVAHMQAACADHIATSYSLERFTASFTDLYLSLSESGLSDGRQHMKSMPPVHQTAKCAE
jgi:glycosyltransferase involved in cell wall biosynthesis